jgi:hypothetical protein
MKGKTFLELNTVGDKVAFLLENAPRTRENDSDLIATYILNEIGTKELGEMTAFDLLAKIANGKITPFATIIRARQDIQKKNDELKGSEFGKRKKSVESPLFKVNIREN